MCDRCDVRRRMHGPQNLRPLRQRRNFSERVADLRHLVVILAAMRGDENPRLRRIEPRPRGLFERDIFFRDRQERVDDGIARHDDIGRRHVLTLEIRTRARRRREMIRREAAGEATVHLFGKRFEGRGRPQARFHVTDRNFCVERSKRSRSRRRRVTMYEHDVGLRIAQNRLHALENARRDLRDRLIVSHDVEIVIRHDPKEGDQIVEHLPVLRRDADDRLDCRPRGGERTHDGRHFDGIGTRAENSHHAKRSSHEKPTEFRRDVGARCRRARANMQPHRARNRLPKSGVPPASR